MGTRYVAGCPPSRSPRNTSKIASAIAPPLSSVVAPDSRRDGGATKSISLPQAVASTRWAFRALVIGAAPLCFPRGRLHCCSFPRLRRDLGDRSGCELLGSLRGRVRCE